MSNVIMLNLNAPSGLSVAWKPKAQVKGLSLGVESTVICSAATGRPHASRSNKSWRRIIHITRNRYRYIIYITFWAREPSMEAARRPREESVLNGTPINEDGSIWDILTAHTEQSKSESLVSMGPVRSHQGSGRVPKSHFVRSFE